MVRIWTFNVKAHGDEHEYPNPRFDALHGEEEEKKKKRLKQGSQQK